MVIVETRNLKKYYHKGKEIIHALDGISLRVEKGEFVSIMGPSGSGKSTLLHLIGCLDRPTEGEILIEGENVTKTPASQWSRLRARKFGFVFQEYNLIPILTAQENVMLALRYARIKDNHRELAQKALEKVGLGNRLNHRPSELSGGEQQRVTIARALINQPSIILGDELTGELDSKTSQEIMKMLLRLNQEGNQTFIVVTHNPEVAKMAHRIVRIKDGKVEG